MMRQSFTGKSFTFSRIAYGKVVDMPSECDLILDKYRSAITAPSTICGNKERLRKKRDRDKGSLSGR
ncbi:hypothetical protein KQX54_001008 [Cotesia glomerata]|uniref:Uncharacterized protein n=1 Tax=Cotesia glomerata TaxID=32391 RepID=A0AAV7HXU8_COTGL|nr:hypothetical protein KQX54_001008 [Cotesia glomerata]